MEGGEGRPGKKHSDAHAILRYMRVSAVSRTTSTPHMFTTFDWNVEQRAWFSSALGLRAIGRVRCYIRHDSQQQPWSIKHAIQDKQRKYAKYTESETLPPHMDAVSVTSAKSEGKRSTGRACTSSEMLSSDQRQADEEGLREGRRKRLPTTRRKNLVRVVDKNRFLWLRGLASPPEKHPAYAN